jgi:2-polyprenyl-3-methyl-5-hydroxy-6-metoxy-1,4-benzoquinol methylase
MDRMTLNAYSELAKNYSEDWLAQPQPSDMYQLLKTFFLPGGKTADIGCGNGRDANWLVKNGFKVRGFDSSSELLAIASELYPNIEFSQAYLPELKELSEPFQNILCETVVMHLQKTQVTTAILNLKRILQKNGVLYLSWRVTEGEDTRHSDGRLYSAFSRDVILDHFDRDGILHFEDKVSVSSGKRVCRLIYRGKGL